MRRSIKSAQRSVRIVSFTVSADGATVSGLDAAQVTVADTGTGVKTVTLSEGFASADYQVQVTTGTADTLAQAAITSVTSFAVSSFDSTDGTTAKDAICYITVIGSDTSERY